LTGKSDPATARNDQAGTVTLPGIAGIVLSIGMAVDSNVLIFERMREEPVLNKPIRFLQILHNPCIAFMRLKSAGFVFSGVLVILGLVASVQNRKGQSQSAFHVQSPLDILKKALCERRTHEG